jgi:hypothetical protein
MNELMNTKAPGLFTQKEREFVSGINRNNGRFVKGNSGGAPVGNNYSGKNALWKWALKHALSEFTSSQVERGQALKEIGRVLVELALAGDVKAIKEIGDRLDGKAVQLVGGDENRPLQAQILVSFVKPE